MSEEPLIDLGSNNRSGDIYDVKRKKRSYRILTIKISEELYDKINDLVEKHNYSNRSDFVRDSIKTYIRLLEILEGESLATFDARIRDLSEIIEKILRTRCK